MILMAILITFLVNIFSTLFVIELGITLILYFMQKVPINFYNTFEDLPDSQKLKSKDQIDNVL